MGNMLNLLTLTLGLVLLNPAYSSRIEIAKLVESKLQEFYVIKYLGGPLLLNHVANYTLEAQAALRLSNELYTGKVTAGITMILRPFRIQLLNISKDLKDTKAAKCAKSDSVYPILDSKGTAITTSNDVLLTNSSRKIADLYTIYYCKCAEESAAKLSTKLEKLAGLDKILKSDFIDKGEEIIRGCGNKPTKEEAQQCIQEFIDLLKLQLSSIIKEVDIKASTNNDVSDVFSLSNFAQDLFFVPDCLLFNSIDSAAAANNILVDIQTCAADAGVPISITKVVAPENTINLRKVYDFLEEYYNITRKPSPPEGEFKIFINYLTYELHKATTIINQNTTLESTLQANIKTQRALRIAAESDSITLKSCVNQAYKVLRANVNDQLRSVKTCADTTFVATRYLQSSLNDSYNLLLNDPQRSNHLDQIPLCIAKNFLNRTALEQCTELILNILTQTLDKAERAFAISVIEITQFYTSNYTVENCKFKYPSLLRLYQCSETDFSFIADNSELDGSLIR